MAPTVSQIVAEGLATPRSVTQLEAYEAGLLMARTEGLIPAPETTHAIAAAIAEARKAKEEGKEKVIVFTWSGHGLLDLSAYDKYLSGQLTNYALSDEDIAKSEDIFRNYPRPELLRSR